MSLSKSIQATSFCLLFSLIQACYYDSEEHLYGTATCDTTSEVKFSTTISPLIASQCATSGCHNATSKAAGVNLSSHSNIQSYITASKAVFLGSIKHESSYSPMPKGGTKWSSCSIQQLEKWINAGMPNN